jgi:Domain of unknown function (DUF4389)
VITVAAIDSYTPSYPVRVDASLDTPLSRWLWLVKWLLVVPHYIVLAFLWVAFVVLSAVAFVAILFTGSYPRSIFDFNVGVLRWTWRVQYYAFGAFATDRYPPFTLADDPAYPAHLEIAYPSRLSRGLVLVKWWLLAIPHYIIVGLFTGGGLWVAWHADQHNSSWPGLIAILAIIAAVVLAVTGRYPRQIFDLVLGLNRWVLRVAAYAALMTDRYPPFRLDMGGHDPGTVLTVPRVEDARPIQDSPPAPQRGWTAGRIVSLVVGSVLAVGSLGMLGAGATAWWADSARHGGYLDLGTSTYASSGYAVESAPIQLPGPAGGWDPVRKFVGIIRVRATGVSGTAPVFIGIAPAGAAGRYLSGVARDTVSDFNGAHGITAAHSGIAPSVPPTQVGIWVVRATSSGTATLSWPMTGGNWIAVAMNADGSRQVNVRVNVAAEFPELAPIAAGLLIGGFIFLGLSIVLILTSASAHRPGRLGRPSI